MTGTTRTAVIIGAGVGGLTAALAFVARGWGVTLLERAPQLSPVGYVLIIAPNAQRALGAIRADIVDDIHDYAAIQTDGGVRNASGSWLSHNDPAIALERYGHPVVAIRRSALVEILASRLPAEVLRLGTTATRVDAGAAEVELDTGEVLRADLVVAADGIRSGTRTSLFAQHPVPAFAGLTTWQALIPGDRNTAHAGTTWGRGGEFGMLRLSDGSVYAFAQAASQQPMVPRPGQAEKDELSRRFSDTYAAVRTAIGRIDPERLLRADIYTFPAPLPALHRARVAVVGDAAHPMAPSLGQGACQAIEDAVTLAYCVDTATTITDGLARYTADRMPRVSLIVRRSEQIARAVTSTNPLVQAVRNGLVRATGLFGPSAALRQADFVMRWDHPAMVSTEGATR